MYGPAGTEQTANTFILGEIRGGRCLFAKNPPTAHGNTISSVGFTNPRATRGSDFFAPWTLVVPPPPDTPYQYPGDSDQPVITNFANNPKVDYKTNNHDQGTVQVLRLLDGWVATD